MLLIFEWNNQKMISMARLIVQDLINAIENAAEELLAAGGSDGMVSKADIRKKLGEQQGVQRAILEAFYDFLKEEDQPYMRITRAVIEKGTAFVKEKLIPQFEITPGGLSEAEVKAMSKLGAAALALGSHLKQAAQDQHTRSAQEIFKEIAQHTQDLYFDYQGSESAQPIEAVLIPAGISELTKETFADAMNLNQNDPLEFIQRFIPAEPFFPVFIDQHASSAALARKATAIVELMRNNLRQHSIFILGKDYDPTVPPQHPVYIVGLAEDGKLVGFKSQVIWT